MGKHHRKQYVVSAMAAVVSGLAAGPVGAYDLTDKSQSILVGPSDPAIYLRRAREARSLLNDQKFAAAEPLFEQLVKDYPLDRTNWLGLANIKRQLGKCAEAIPAYNEAIKLVGPVPGQSRKFIAACQVALKDTQGALNTLDKIVHEDVDLGRPTLADQPQYAALKSEPRINEITGKLDYSSFDRVRGWRADLDYLLGEVNRAVPEFRGRALPADTLRLAAALREEIPSLSDEQVYVRMGQVVGSLGLHHTLFGSMGFGQPNGSEKVRETYLPLRFYAFPEGIFIVDAAPEYKELVGAKLLSINGVQAEDVLTRVASVLSAGSNSEAYWTGPRRLSEGHLLEGLGVTPSSLEAQLSLQTKGGRNVDRIIKASSTADLPAKLVPPAGVPTPLFLRNVKESHWMELWPESDTAYVQVNQIFPDPDETLAQFGVRLRTELKAKAPKNLIVDLRHNNGGDTFSYPELLRTLIAYTTDPQNRLYVLIGRNTYSAAANLSTDLERLAQPIFVGEPTSATGNQEGDEFRYVLPWSGVRGQIGGVWWQLSHPWDKRRSIAPQVPVQLTAASYFAGQDPALEVVKRIIADDKR